MYAFIAFVFFILSIVVYANTGSGGFATILFMGGLLFIAAHTGK